MALRPAPPPETPGGPRAGWALTPEAFERLLDLLGPDREAAGERYEALRRRLLRLFAWRGFPHADELVDATFDRVARKVDAGTELYARDPYSYLHGVAVRIAQEHSRGGARQRPLVEAAVDARAAHEWPAGAQDAERRAAEERRLRCLDECLAALPEEARSLLRRYHGGNDAIRDRQALARELGLSATALRLRAFRLRGTVHGCVAACAGRAAGETERPGTA